MAGEYVRWLARDVKPVEKKELTPREQRRNWWNYHKWHVLLGLVVLILAADLVFDAVEAGRNAPDYTIAYVGAYGLPEYAVPALEEAVAALGEDLNGNGTVAVELVEYRFSGSEEQSLSDAMTMTVQLEAAEHVIYLLEEPEGFADTFPVLCHTDGTPLGEQTDAPLYYLWKDCPALTGLALDAEGIVQQGMSGVAVARREIWESEPTEETLAALRLWEKLTAGAE